MKDKKQEKPKQQPGPIDPDQLLDTLLKQKDELFNDTFLTAVDKDLIGRLPEEQRESVRNALLEKGVLFKKLLGKLQRVSADYTNFQKQIPKQIASTIAYEKEKMIKTLLPVLDNFEHTLQNAHAAENADVFIKGVQIIHDQMLDILKSYDVEQIKALGEKFDPALHQAMMQKTEHDKEENVVLEEFQKGYKLNDRVLRPSKVSINKLPPKLKQEAEQPKQAEQKQTKEDCQKTDAE
jgi:molecular chaperone GrpE